MWNSLAHRIGKIGTTFCRISQTASGSSPAWRQFSAVSSLSQQRQNLHQALSQRKTVCPLSSNVLQPSPGSLHLTPTRTVSLEAMHRKGQYCKVRKKKMSPLEGNPQLRGVILKALVKKPKKPNSANRKCVRLRLTNGKEVTAYVPGEGHNLQEHNIVLVQGGKLQDTPGVKLVCVRGKYDLPHVKKKA